MSAQSLNNERELLQRIAEGDKDAFVRLHDHYWATIYYAGLSFLKSPDRALDAVQDIFLKLWEKREILSSIENFKPFLMTMVRNELINALQKKARRETVYKELRQQLPDYFMLPQEYMDHKELETLIATAIASLSDQQQTIYRLTREEGLSHSQIADQLGLAPKTVANTITKTLNYLREYLAIHANLCAGMFFLFL